MRQMRIAAGSLAGMVAVSTAIAAPVPLDISDAFNYDAVGTRNEVLYANTKSGNHTLFHILTNHNMRTSGGSTFRTFTTQGSLTGAGTALPNNGAITATGGDYQISTAYDQQSGSDYVKSNNVLFLNASATSGTLVTVSGTVTLKPSEQKNYEDINLLFTQSRNTSSGSYRTLITATYADSSTGTIFDSGLDVVATNGLGGTLGSGSVGTGGLNFSTDTDAAVSHVFTSASTRLSGSTGSGTAASTIDTSAGNASNLWQLTDRFELDPTKTLVSLTFQVSASTNGRFNEFTLFGLNATEAVPEPATATLFGGAAAALLLRRRRLSA